MEIKIYGLSEKQLQNKDKGKYLGTYNGIAFTSKKYKMKDLEKFDYLQFYVSENMILQGPKRFNKNIENKLGVIFNRQFGEFQTSLF